MSVVALYNKTDNTEIIKSPIMIQEMSWIKNKAGRLVFRLPIDHPMAKRNYLRWGTRVSAKVEGFPLWVGFIEPPRTWGNGSIKVVCRSMEYLMYYRRQRFVAAGDKVSAPYTIKGTAGELASQMLDIANAFKYTGIDIGEVFTGGGDRQETLSGKFYNHLNDIADRSNCRWYISGMDTNGVLSMKLNLVEYAPVLTDYLIEEGVNLETPESDDFLIEDNELYNDVLGLGDNASVSGVAAYNAKDSDTIEEYDLRQTVETFTNNVELSTIKKNAEQYLAQHVEPVSSLNPMLPYSADLAARLSLDTILPLRLYSAGFKPDGSIGFDGYIPIQSITYLGTEQQISLVVSAEES